MEANEILKKLREDKGLTMKEVSEATKMLTPLISDYETGKKAMGMKVAIRFADYYNVSLDYLMGRTSVKHMATEQPDPLADVDISDVEKRAIMKYTALDETMRAVCIEAFRQISGVLITEDGEVKQTSEKSKQEKLIVKFASQIPPQSVVNEPPPKPDIQISQTKDSERAICRSENGMYKPVPTDEQLSTMEEVTPDMLGE